MHSFIRSLDVKRYTGKKLSHDFLSLLKGRVFMQIAGGLMNLFIPIFIYQIFDLSFKMVAIFYILSSALYVLLLPLSGKFIEKHGIRSSIQVGVVFGIIHFTTFYLMGASSEVIMLLVISGLSLTLYRFFFWVPYHTDISILTSKSSRSREIAILQATMTLIGVLTPILAGIIISKWSFSALFLIGLFIFVICLIPLSKIKNIKEQFVWSYGKTFKKLFGQKEMGVHLSFFARGIETTAKIVVWPIFLFEILKGDYLEIGLISSAVVLLTILLQLITGKLADKVPKISLVRIGTILSALGWVVKIFVATAFQVFIVDTYHGFTRAFVRVSYNSMVYEDAADHGHYVDEYTVLREMSIHFGRIISLIGFTILYFALGLQWAFALAALAALALNFFQYKH